MDAVQDMVIHQGYASIELTNLKAVDFVVAQLLDASQECQRHDIVRLAVYVPRVSSPEMSTLHVFQIITALVPQWNRRLHVAVILSFKPGQLEEFALLVARNRGINISMFSNENEALAWLNP